MNDEDFMKELEELTQNMTKEFNQEKSNQSAKENTNTSDKNEKKQDFNFDFNFQGNEMDYMKEIEKLLTMGGLNLGPEDESDPKTKEMINLLNENLKDLENKVSLMQKEMIQNTKSDGESKSTISVEKSTVTTGGNVNTNTTSNSQNTTKPSNPFVDTFREMNNNPSGDLFDMLKMLENLPGGGEEGGDMKNLFEILGKLSDNKGENTQEESGDKKQLESLFGTLLEFLLKSNMLAEPLSQIRQSVLTYLDKKKEELKPDEEEKYKSMLNYIDTIMAEINKESPNKGLIIEVFYKLHELSDLDGEILSDSDSAFKKLSDLLGSNIPDK